MIAGNGRGISRAILNHHTGRLLAGSCVACLAFGPALAQDEEETVITLDGATQLQQLVVTAAGFEQNVADAPASISVISREDLEKGAFRDLTDALKEVQGVSVTGIANERDIFIRGLPGQYTLILVDGKRQTTRDARPNGSSGYEQSFIPPISAIERIEVVRGPMSSLYGSDAMGGVINIITRKVSDVWTGEVTVEGTVQENRDAGDSGQVSFYGAGPIVNDVMGLQVWGRGLRRGEDHFLDGFQGNREGNLAGRLTITPNADHDIFLEAGTSRVRGYTSAGKVLADTANDSYRDYDRDHWSISHTGRWGPTTSDFSFQQEWGQRTTTTWSPGLGSFVENPRAPKVRNSVLDGKFTTPFDMLGQHTLVTGGQFRDTTLTDQGHLPEDQTISIQQWAVFAEDEWQMTDSFALTGGLRMDHHEVYGTHFSPRLYGVWHATNNLTLKGGVSTGFRAPEIRQIAPGYYMPTQQGVGLIAPNPDLQPESSVNYEIGALYDNYAGFTAGATLFYTEFSDKLSNMNTHQLVDPVTGDIIDPLGGASCNAAALGPYPGYSCLWQNFNIDEAVIRGIELTSTWDATDALTLRASYTFTDSEQTTGAFAGFPLARTPKHRASLRADWMTPVENLDVWGTLTYHGSEINAGARIGGNGTPVVIDGATGRKYDPYTTVDFGGSYAFSESVRLNAAIYNVFDKTLDVGDYNATIDGRRLWVSLSSTF
ncbi:TonB-dependent receptor domain-containing protein [Aliihoeflea sp. PC F10.4]